MTSSVLELARGGDERAFQELTAPYFRELHLHCYRMLGSVTDADDLMQEILLAAWSGLAGFAGRSSVRTWLYRIATNRCLNAIRAGKRRPPTEPMPPFEPPEPTRRGEVTWLQPYPDAWLDQLPEDRAVRRETVELAFVTALQRVPPRQAAVLVLVDVLGFTIAEVAELMDTGPTAVKGALQRARAAMRREADAVKKRRAAGCPAMDEGAVDTRRAVGDEGRRFDGRVSDDSRAAADCSSEVTAEIGAGSGSADAATAGEWMVARRFAEAFVADDIEAVTRLLTDDAWLAMPPAPHEYHGPAAIAEFLRASAAGRRGKRLRLDPSGCNLQPGFVCYFVDDTTVWYAGRFVLAVRGERISRITRFLEPALEKALAAAG
ncbi:RNA polymerase subunit sigma-70 [Kribbella sp. ALI-6-A]|uniref:RNA polymerase subunit sigma-70 n=1 Tax=Kribbella sp. ALI-6-A TaxID=1933817 RepID=UPI001EDB9108|nr:RNA polymerase subunit sigma-70 [Kribbella sp. ALI-6-A]